MQHATGCLGIDGGGTGTTARYVEFANAISRESTFGPLNVRLLSDAELRATLRKIQKEFPNPAAVCIGAAGARTAADRARVERLARNLWAKAKLRMTHDLEIALEAAPEYPGASVLVLSGTGSCCYGKSTDGREVKRGGWGHLLGDVGSGYAIGANALRAVIRDFDITGELSEPGRDLLRRLALNEPDDLIAWMQQAEKAEVAAIAPAVFEFKRDRSMARVISEAAEGLTNIAAACAREVEMARDPVRFVFAGSVLVRERSFRARCETILRSTFPRARFHTLTDSPALGACKMAARLLNSELPTSPHVSHAKAVTSARLSPTEARNPRSMVFDLMPVESAVELMLNEERRVPAILLKHKAAIAQGVTIITRALKGGGRLFYVGAGTSGRLGALDASECPPTFRSDPRQVQAIMAGGQRAFWTAVEGAEDDADAGARAVEHRGIQRGDVLVGIAASGRTPFVWGALRAAKAVGAKTILVCFNPYLQVQRSDRPTLIIAADLGAEVLTGSTRLKAGTATKLILNAFTTIAMARLGKVMTNLMIDLNPSNVKLRDRAARIVSDLSGADYNTARATLEKNGWIVKDATLQLRKSAKRRKV